jgi:radical SAM-linked protein
MVGEKFRLRFEKTGELRLLSHHDLMRCAERMLRRAELPFKRTEGFHPTPRFVFALSLSLGIVGRAEVVELELTEPRDADVVLASLQRQAPIGWTFTSVKVVPMKASAFPRRMVYRLPLPTDRLAATRTSADELLASEKVWVERYKPKPRRVNIRPYLRNIHVTSNAVELDIWVTGTGSARADELLRLLGLHDVWDAGAILERTQLELHDEVTHEPSDSLDRPPDGPAETLPLNLPVGAVPLGDEPSTEPTWGGSPNGPVVE